MPYLLVLVELYALSKLIWNIESNIELMLSSFLIVVGPDSTYYSEVAIYDFFENLIT